MTYEPRKTEHFSSPHSPGVMIQKWYDNPYRVLSLLWDGSAGLYMTPKEARAYAAVLLKAADAAEKLNNTDL